MEINELDKSPRDYEISFIGPTEAALAIIQKALAEQNVEVKATLMPQQLILAYPIKKHQAAVFGAIQFRALPEKISLMEKELLLKPEVLRFLVVGLPVSGKAVVKKVAVQEEPLAPPPPKPFEMKPPKETLTNEALEQKLEEILQ